MPIAYRHSSWWRYRAGEYVCYSAAFYFLVRNYLNRQFDDDLHQRLQILSASVEVEPDDAKWHPAEHGIDLNQHILNELIWVVTNGAARLLIAGTCRTIGGFGGLSAPAISILRPTSR